MSDRPERRQTTAATVRQQDAARIEEDDSARRAIDLALQAAAPTRGMRLRLQRAGKDGLPTPKGLLMSCHLMLVSLLSDEKASTETRARLGVQLIAEQRKILEKWKLSDAEPARIQLEWMSPEACEAVEDDLGTAD